MTDNPFESGAGDWLVVVNGLGQHALWRPFLDLPDGWRIVHSGPDRAGALAYVERNWTVS